jgi:hypothetical protein
MEALAVEVRLPLPEDLPQDGQILAQIGKRLCEGNAKQSFDGGLVARADTQVEASRREALRDEGLGRKHQRVAREDRHDRGAEADTGGARRGRGKDAHGVGRHATDGHPGISNAVRVGTDDSINGGAH